MAEKRDYLNQYRQQGRQNCGHAGGDLVSFWKGIQWSQKNGIEVLCKLSQRFVPLRERWLQEGAAELMRSGKAAMSDVAIEGPYTLPLRTEAMLMRIDRWHREDVLRSLRPRRVFPYSGEAIVGQAMEKVGGGFAAWRLLNGPDRSRRNPNALWHCSSALDDYYKLGDSYGVDLRGELFLHGWAKNTQNDWG
jgi:hypothetical protein